MGAEGNQSLLRRGDVHTTALQSIQIQIPGVLERHSGNAERMALDPVYEIGKTVRLCGGSGIAAAIGWQGFRLGIFPMQTDIIAGFFRGICAGRKRSDPVS